jgi:hypothetical protein
MTFENVEYFILSMVVYLSCSQFLRRPLNVVENFVNFKSLSSSTPLFHHLYNPLDCSETPHTLKNNWIKLKPITQCANEIEILCK